MALGFLLVGAVTGAAGLHRLVRPILGRPGPARTVVNLRNLTPRALVADAPFPSAAAPGETVVTTWVVINTGQAPWAVDEYRFVPEDYRLPLLTLPRTIGPGARATLRTAITMPNGPGSWTARWQLVGTRGPVEGGELTATFFLTGE